MLEQLLRRDPDRRVRAAAQPEARQRAVSDPAADRGVADGRQLGGLTHPQQVLTLVRNHAQKCSLSSRTAPGTARTLNGVIELRTIEQHSNCRHLPPWHVKAGDDDYAVRARDCDEAAFLVAEHLGFERQIVLKVSVELVLPDGQTVVSQALEKALVGV